MTPTLTQKLSIGLVAGCLIAPAALAAERQRIEFPIDLAELKAEAEARFAAADSDADGMISADEFAAMDRSAMTAALPRGDRLDKRGKRRGRDGRGSRAGGPRPNFEAQDANGDGSISQDEFARPQSDLFARADADGDGALSEDEYRGLREAGREMMRERAQERTFARLDDNGDSVLTPDEFSSRHARLAALDADGDGQISRDEFQRRPRR